MAVESERSERDLVLAPNEYALIQDQTKGCVDVYVGPLKTSLSAQDKPVFYDFAKDKFSPSNLDMAIRQWPNADEGSYIILSNPTEGWNSGKGQVPNPGSKAQFINVLSGRKINIPGPARFPLFPGQHAEVVKGHRLHSNQYLLVRVTNPEEAEKNWNKAVVMKTSEAGEETVKAEVVVPKPEKLSIGQQIIIKGTEVSFYIPPTGIEVVKTRDKDTDKERYTRDALTLELLEYCILKSENGNKRYEKGPAVVFPRPDEVFIEQDESRKFKAIELNHLMGLYIKVIADYEEGEKKFKVGDELFITGKDQRIYYPREEHSIIEYDGNKTHYAVAIPSGEGRYVLNRETGEIFIKRGPCMFLPDPRKEVVVRRILDSETCDLLFPGNDEAKSYNDELQRISDEATNKHGNSSYVKEQSYIKRSAPAFAASAKLASLGTAGVASYSNSPDMMAEMLEKAVDYKGGRTERKVKYTPTRSITLNTKYDGVVSVNIYNGYAVLVVDKKGGRRVEVGPKTILLEYDETLEAMNLSTGKPKTTDNILKTVYLRVLNNKVSDLLTVETKDSCNVTLKLSYRVNFEGESPEKWFAVENYVKFLTDHIRSLLKNSVRKFGVEEFYQSSIDIVRDTILGTHGEDGKRPGKLFEENNMRIYDVEVLEVEIGDKSIKDLLIQAQHVAVKQAIEIAQARKGLVIEKEKQSIVREVEKSKSETETAKAKLQLDSIHNNLSITLEQIKATSDKQAREAELALAAQELQEKIAESARNQKKLDADQLITLKREEAKIEIERVVQETEALVKKAGAIQPDLIAALQSFGDKELVEKLAESVAPLAIISKTGITDVVKRLFEGTPIAGFVTEKVADFGSNGTGVRKTLAAK